MTAEQKKRIAHEIGIEKRLQLPCSNSPHDRIYRPAAGADRRAGD